MENMNHDLDMTMSKRAKKWSLFKILVALGLTIIIFGGGVAAGRGDIHFRGLKLSKTSTIATSLDYSSVDQLYGLLKDDFDGQLDPTKLLDGLKTGLVNAANDPYTAYFNPAEANIFNEQLTGSFTGIGAELGTDASNNIVIVSPLSGYPAEKAGLKPKDIILSIDGQTTAGLSVDKIVQKIRGPADTVVKLTIQRGTDKPFDTSITRQQITIPSVSSSVDGAIGYLKISQFTNDTAKLSKNAAADFKTKEVKAVILDLRGDPGGYLDVAVDVSSLWLDQGETVVSERRGGQTLTTDYASGGNILKGLPTVVLLNGGSASASEIVAGALRDNGAATIVGEKSFGKGSVQQVVSLPGGGELKVTIARWYTPAGKNIDKQGITPDVTVTISDADAAGGKDPQKDKATEILRGKIASQ
ncbi:S41 family peptidase [Candidatus Saccharibacteria bacterium]|nr:S41 family peptidase [Candidatus Saccharibacteria bacterium]